MLDLQSVRLLHLHGSEWAELKAAREHTSVDHDPERGWIKGIVFECDCGDRYTVVPEDQPDITAGERRR